MSLANNMEFVLVAAIAMVTVTGIAGATIPAIPAAATPLAAAPFDAKIQVVTVVGKRLTAAEKARVTI